MSRTKRQIDILIEDRIAGFDLKVIVDCKYFNKKVDVKEVESFLSFLQDLKASKGVLITNEGYTKAAHNRATYDTQDIELRIIDFADLDAFQGFIAIPYSGSHCAIVTAPDGWVVDASRDGPYLASFYPAGLTSKEAFLKEGFAYLLISKKDKSWPDLPHMLSLQKEKAESHYKKPRIEYLNSIKREDCGTLLRVLDAQETPDTNEYTIFLDYPGVIIFITLLTPILKEDEYCKKLEWIAEKLIKGNVILGKDGQPSNLNV
jgi:hypothetical protein